MTSTKLITYRGGGDDGGEAGEPETPPVTSGVALNLLDDGLVVVITAQSVAGAGD